VIGIFNVTPQVVTLGASYLRIMTMCYVFLAMSMVLASALNGAGDAVSPMVILAATFLGVRIVLAYLLPTFFGLGTTGIWIAVSVAYVFQGIAMAVRFRAGRWKSRLV
jgi:Na+-driven multidrug efflux pump